MIPVPSKEDIEKLKILHDKIKNHEFRKNPQKYLLDEYAELFKQVYNIIPQFANEEYDYENHCYKYLYYRGVKDRWLHYKDSHKPDGYFHYNDIAEVWSNPTIALYNYSVHDYNGILWKLKSNWDGIHFKDLFGRYTETAEKRLILIHSIINGELITEMSFPFDRIYSKDYCTYKMVRNPHYDNDWTLEKYLHKEWYEDKGYVD